MNLSPLAVMSMRVWGFSVLRFAIFAERRVAASFGKILYLQGRRKVASHTEQDERTEPMEQNMMYSSEWC